MTSPGRQRAAALLGPAATRPLPPPGGHKSQPPRCTGCSLEQNGRPLPTAITTCDTTWPPATWTRQSPSAHRHHRQQGQSKCDGRRIIIKGQQAPPKPVQDCLRKISIWMNPCSHQGEKGPLLAFSFTKLISSDLGEGVTANKTSLITDIDLPVKRTAALHRSCLPAFLSAAPLFCY